MDKSREIPSLNPYPASRPERHITVRGVHILYHCAHQVRTSLNSLYIPLSVLAVVEISTALV